MLKRLLCYSQYILPQHGISTVMGKMANSRNVRFKNKLIDRFCEQYQVDLSESALSNPHDYPTFNDFFTRALKPDARPIVPGTNTIASPADGKVAAFGPINRQQIYQAKDMYFDTVSLLGGQTSLADMFNDGQFLTVYLAPHNYHRVHMPITGRLRQSIYIPGKLFSVNRMTSQLIPNLYARNERLVLVFDTEIGAVAVILVGALIVGSMQTIWMNEPIRSNKILIDTPVEGLRLEKGAELGRFLLGSTVVVLFPKSDMNWAPGINFDETLRVGQLISTVGP